MTCEIKKPGEDWKKCGTHHYLAGNAYSMYFTSDNNYQSPVALVSVPHPLGGMFEAIFRPVRGLFEMLKKGGPMEFSYDEIYRDDHGNPIYGNRGVLMKYNTHKAMDLDLSVTKVTPIEEPGSRRYSGSHDREHLSPRPSHRSPIRHREHLSSRMSHRSSIRHREHLSSRMSHRSPMIDREHLRMSHRSPIRHRRDPRSPVRLMRR